MKKTIYIKQFKNILKNLSFLKFFLTKLGAILKVYIFANLHLRWKKLENQSIKKDKKIVFKINFSILLKIELLHIDTRMPQLLQHCNIHRTERWHVKKLTSDWTELLLQGRRKKQPWLLLVTSAKTRPFCRVSLTAMVCFSV